MSKIRSAERLLRLFAEPDEVKIKADFEKSLKILAMRGSDFEKSLKILAIYGIEFVADGRASHFVAKDGKRLSIEELNI